MNWTHHTKIIDVNSSEFVLSSRDCKRSYITLFFQPLVLHVYTIRRSIYTTADEKVGRRAVEERRTGRKTAKEIEPETNGRRQTKKNPPRHARGNKIRYSYEKEKFVDIHSNQSTLFASAITLFRI